MASKRFRSPLRCRSHALLSETLPGEPLGLGAYLGE